MTNIINWGIIATAAITIILTVLQDKSSGGGGVFGGGSVGGAYQTKRGAEKLIFIFTIVLITAFSGLSLLNLTSFGRGSLTSAAGSPDVQIQSVSGDGVSIGDVKVTTMPADETSTQTENSGITVTPVPAE